MKKKITSILAVCFLTIFGAMMFAGCGNQSDRTIQISTTTWTYAVNAEFGAMKEEVTVAFTPTTDIKEKNEVLYAKGVKQEAAPLTKLIELGLVAKLGFDTRTATASGETRKMNVTIMGETFRITYTVA